jgi:hypothetical protein
MREGFKLPAATPGRHANQRQSCCRSAEFEMCEAERYSPAFDHETRLTCVEMCCGIGQRPNNSDVTFNQINRGSAESLFLPMHPWVKPKCGPNAGRRLPLLVSLAILICCVEESLWSWSTIVRQTRQAVFLSSLPSSTPRHRRFWPDRDGPAWRHQLPQFASSDPPPSSPPRTEPKTLFVRRRQ